MAERAVQTVKQRLAKIEGTINDRLSRFLFSYRITPQMSTGMSPAELLMGRRLRTRLDRIHPDTSIQKKVDPPNKPARTFDIGSKVYARDYTVRGKWISATVSQITGPLSYVVRLNDGSTMRRHVDQLRLRHTPDEPLDSNIADLDPFSSCLGRATTVADPPIRPQSTSAQAPLPLCRSTRIRNPIVRLSPGGETS